MKYWEIIADNLNKAGSTLGCVSALDSDGPVWNVDAASWYRHRFIVRADKKLTAFLEFESARDDRAHPQVAIPWPDRCLRSQPEKLP